MSDQATIDKLEQVWQSIDELCDSFTELEWRAPTDCPGWSVQDSVAHVIDYESRMMQKPVPEHTPPSRPHMKNDLGARNEIVVDWFRAKTGAEVLAAYRELITERSRGLRAMTAEAWDGPSPASPRGEPMREHLERRVVDCWTHEQDIRRAVSRPGHTTGEVVTHVMQRMLPAMGMVVGRKAGAPPDSTVVFALTGPYVQTQAFRMEGERATRCEPVPERPTVRLTLDSETFACLVFGRWAPEKVLESGRVLFAGDRELGRTIVRQMGITP